MTKKHDLSFLQLDRDALKTVSSISLGSGPGLPFHRFAFLPNGRYVIQSHCKNGQSKTHRTMCVVRFFCYWLRCGRFRLCSRFDAEREKFNEFREIRSSLNENDESEKRKANSTKMKNDCRKGNNQHFAWNNWCFDAKLRRAKMKAKKPTRRKLATNHKMLFRSVSVHGNYRFLQWTRFTNPIECSKQLIGWGRSTSWAPNSNMSQPGQRRK